MNLRRPVALLVSTLLLGAAPAGAATWEPESVQIPTLMGNASLGKTRRPAGADDQGRVHLVYQSAVGEDAFEVLYVVRDSGGTWGTPLVLTAPGTFGRNATLDVDEEGGIHVAWESPNPDGGDIVYRKRGPDGSWGDAFAVASAPGASVNPLITVDAFGRVHLVWLDGRSGRKELVHTLSPGDGTFSPLRTFSTGGGLSDDPAMDVDGLGNVHLAWTDRVGTHRDGITFDVFYIHLEPGKEETATPIPLVSGGSYMTEPHLAVTEDGTVHLVWLDDRTITIGNPSEVFYRRFLPGIGWGHVKRFSYDDTQHGQPVIVEGAGRSMNVVWEDYRRGNPEIYYRQITEETGWDPEATRLTTDPSASETPTLVALPDGKMLLVWTDSIDSGTVRVYAKLGSVKPAP